MFDLATFDSRTWHQRAYGKRLRYLRPHPYPLSAVNIDPIMNLRNELAKYTGSFERILGHLELEEKVTAEELVDIYNIRAIEDFAEMVLTDAMIGKLPEYIIQLTSYQNQKRKIMRALELLQDSKSHGHPYVRKQYSVHIV